MQEVGKTKINGLKILSIQFQLGGLSFYCGRDKKYSFRQMRDNDEITPVIVKEIHGESYDVVNYYHNSPNYIIIPRELFDENMCDAYLLTKDIKPASNEIISVTLTADLAYVSCVKGDFSTIDGVEVNVYPIVAKCYHFCSGYESNVIAYVIEDNMLHICYFGDGKVRFCETLPLVSSSDFEFFLDSMMRRFGLKKGAKIISLYENGAFVARQDVLTRYAIKSISKEDYFQI